MATILNRQVTFSTNGTVTAAGLHNLIDETEIYAGIITTQPVIASVGSSDQLLIADADLTPTSAPRRVTVGSMFNDALNNGIYTSSSFTGTLTAGSFVGPLNGSVNGTIVSTTGTIATLNSTTGTIANLAATTSTFLGTITGSTNVVNIGSGQIYKDANGNVGVGVTPSTWGTSEYKAIQVGIGGSISGRVSSGDQDKVNVAANVYHDGSVFKYIASDDATIYQQTGGIHIFSNAPSGTAGNTATFTERLRIDSSGNVGIGTASPSAPLHVSGAGVTAVKITGGSSANQGSYAVFQKGSTDRLFVGVASAVLGSGSTSNDSMFWTESTNNKLFYTNGAERLRIDASGNCSIGTATALSKLHIHGDLTLSNATTAVTASTSTITPPATVAGYLTVSINGTSRKIPYYAT